MAQGIALLHTSVTSQLDFMVLGPEVSFTLRNTKNMNLDESCGKGNGSSDVQNPLDDNHALEIDPIPTIKMEIDESKGVFESVKIDSFSTANSSTDPSILPIFVSNIKIENDSDQEGTSNFVRPYSDTMDTRVGEILEVQLKKEYSEYEASSNYTVQCHSNEKIEEVFELDNLIQPKIEEHVFDGNSKNVSCDSSTKNMTVENIFNLWEQPAVVGDREYEETDIFICPPEPNVLTDEDSADEDDGGTIDNLSGRHLASIAEMTKNKRMGLIEDFKSFIASENRLWVEGDLEYIPTAAFSEASFQNYKNLSPVNFFELFFDNEMINHLVKETERYALYKNSPNPQIKPEEMKCFLGILILSGYNKLPGKKYYWDTKADMHNKIVADAMRRDRFIKIMSCIHAADNSQIDMSDKMWKLQPMIKILKKNFLAHFIPYEYLDYSQSMIKYYGSHSCKQFVRGKPISFGYKAWCLNTDYGYLVDFEIYQGKNAEGTSIYETVFGKCAAPLIGMLDRLPEKPYQLYFDNLFTGLNLLSYLKRRGYNCTGILRANRLPEDCPLTNNKKMKRGTYESTIEWNDGVFVCRWMDNSVVTIASTAHGIAPVCQVKRYSSKDKSYVTIPQPNVFNKYSRHIGGTNKMDGDVGKYRISIRGKKWWWPIFIWFIDVALNNGWALYKKSVKNITKLEFMRHVAQIYLTKYKTPIKSAGGQTSSGRIDKRVLRELRFDRTDHFMGLTIDNKRRRCVGKNCTSVIRTRCEKCDVGLCVVCFAIFHLKQ